MPVGETIGINKFRSLSLNLSLARSQISVLACQWNVCSFNSHDLSQIRVSVSHGIKVFMFKYIQVVSDNFTWTKHNRLHLFPFPCHLNPKSSFDGGGEVLEGGEPSVCASPSPSIKSRRCVCNCGCLWAEVAPPLWWILPR